MKTLRLVFLVILITSCSGRAPKKIIPVFDLQNPKGKIDLNLSELLEDIHIVKLETAEEILLGQNTNYLVGERYIITIDNDKILQFSSDGKFLKTLAKAGKGPDEFLRADAFAMDETNDILYLNHRGDFHNIITYDLKSGEQTGRFSTGVENIISGIIVLNDSVLTIVPRMNKDYNLYYLTTSGRVLNGIAPPVVKGIGLETSIGKVSGNLNYMPKEYDTMYIVSGQTKDPYCFFSVEDRFTFENNETGNFVYLFVNAPVFMIANKAHARIKMNEDGETFSMNADKLTRYFINKKDFSVHEVIGFHNDFLGIEEIQNPWINYLFITDNLGYVCYSSFKLKNMIIEALDCDRPDETVKLRISELAKLIDENDNPVLVVGKLRTYSK